ncbi:MAG: leucine-rich repeat domain-containing protein [Treponema sp.]|nr:leucine-rich repeat domain-containing protein [Treponema sp.]
MKTLFDKLPFQKLAEQNISAEKRVKSPFLGKVTQWANYIACGLVLVLVVVIIAACSGGKKDNNKGGGGSGRANPASDFAYDLTADGKGIVITRYTGGAGVVIVPAQIEGMPVTEIGEGAFSGSDIQITTTQSGRASARKQQNDRAGIVAITIPNTVTEIGSWAFQDTAITRFTMPDSVVEIGHGVFSGCDNLAELRLSDNITILKTLSGLSGLKSLRKANLPAKLEILADNTFFGCGELSELIIPDSIQSVRFLIEMVRDEWVEPTESYEWLMFSGCGKLPIRTRQAIQGWGYKGTF